MLKITLTFLSLIVLIESAGANNGCWRSIRPQRIILSSSGETGLKINSNPVQCEGTRSITYHREGIRCTNTWATGSLSVRRVEVSVSLFRVQQEFNAISNTDCAWGDSGPARPIGMVMVTDCVGTSAGSCPSNDGVEPDPGS